MNLIPFVVLWSALALIVLILAVYRRRITRGEDDTIHVLEGDQRYVVDQAKLATKLEVIDKWGKIATVVTIVYGLILVAIYTYSLFTSNEIRMG
jgi:hypothetical protein